MRPLPRKKPRKERKPDARRRMVRDGRDGALLADPSPDPRSRDLRRTLRQEALARQRLAKSVKRKRYGGSVRILLVTAGGRACGTRPDAAAKNTTTVAD